jgi:steroid delta-isomerase-like uncharacterized protein
MEPVAAMERLYDLINAGDLDRMGDVMADSFTEHDVVPGLEPSKEGVLELFRMYRAAFPDLRMEVDDLLVSGDRVVAQVRATGTHTGEPFMGLQPSGKSINVPLIDITRFDADGLALEHWGVFDALSMMQQLGAIPEMAPPT